MTSFRLGIIFAPIFAFLLFSGSASAQPSNTLPSELPRYNVGHNLNVYDNDIGSNSECYPQSGQNQQNPDAQNWISLAGKYSPDASVLPGIPITYNEHSVSLQDNFLLMFCHSPIPSSSEVLYDYNCQPSTQSCILSNEAPANADLKNNDLNYYQILIDHVDCTSITPSTSDIQCDGTDNANDPNNDISFGLNNKSIEVSSSNERYWYDNAPFTLSLNNGKTFKSNIEINFTLWYYDVNSWSGTPYCVNGGHYDGGNISNCPISHTNGNLYLNVSAPDKWTISTGSTVDLIGGSVADSQCSSNQTQITALPGQSVNFHHCITNNGPEPSDSPIAYTVSWSKGKSGTLKTGTLNSGMAVETREVYTYSNFIIPNVPDGTEYCQQLVAQPDSPSGGSTSSQACVTVGSPGKSSPCPTPPWLSPQQTVGISLPDAPQPSGTYSYGPPEPTPSPASQWVEAFPGPWDITNSHDQYSNPTPAPWSPGGYQYSNYFTLDYSQYISQYPYDDHATEVDFNQQYTGLIYYPYLAYYTCNNYPSYTSDSPTCYGINILTYQDPQYPVTTTSCHEEGSGKKKHEVCTTTTNYYYYPCYYPYEGPSGGQCIYYQEYTYTGEAWYDYYYGGSETLTSQSSYYGAPQLPEICPRNFTIEPPSSTDITQVSLYGGTPDQPTTATVSTQTTAQFSLIYGPTNIRHPMSVNGINYDGTYYIEHADGSSPTPVGNYPDSEYFNIGSTYSNNGDVTYPYSTTFGVSMPPLEVGDQICAQFSDTPQQGQVDEYGNIESASGTQYSTSIPTNPTCSSAVSNAPYARFYGNDVVSGIKYEGSGIACSPSTSGIIANQSPDSGALARGSGAQFAAMSLGQISYFASAFLRNASPTSINGLTFANSSGGYGGSFDNSSSSCPTVFNYYAEKTNSDLQTVYGNGTFDISNYSNQVQLIGGAGTYTVLLGDNLQGTRVIYVDGNVFIANNITYDSSGSFDTSTGKVSNAPSLYVIVLGNIYIDPSVTQLDGTYVAENQCDISGCGSYDPSQGGVINTCADINNINPVNSSGAFPSDQVFSNCNNQLTVTGSLIGHTVKLERTYASMRNSTNGENPLSGPVHDCSFGNGTTNPSSGQDCSAEVFNFDPENYLGVPNFDSSQKNNFDSIVSLPPVL